MAHRYARLFRVRSYECDWLGHVNNAVYQHYLEQIAIEASDDAGFDGPWYDAHGTAWVLRGVTVEVLRPAISRDVLEVSTWVSSWRRVRAQREYHIRRPADGALIVRA